MQTGVVFLGDLSSGETLLCRGLGIKESVLDFDVVLVDASFLRSEASAGEWPSLPDQLLQELPQFFKNGGRVVIFAHQGSTYGALSQSFGGFTAQKRTTVSPVVDEGRQLIEVASEIWNIDGYFAEHSGNPGQIDLIKSLTGDAIVRALPVGSGFVFALPAIGLTRTGEDGVSRYAHPELIAIADWAKNFRTGTPEVVPAPDWTARLTVEGEVQARARTEAAADQLEASREESRVAGLQVAQLERWKTLVYSTGPELEQVVKEAFELLGGQMDELEQGRADLRMTLGGKRVVVEVKGKTSSAAERDAAQLEKWVSAEIDAEKEMPKAVLVVTGYREKPLDERDVVFPHQMLRYSADRRHCLLTGRDLFMIVNRVLANGSCAEFFVKGILELVGPTTEAFWNSGGD